MHTTHLTGTWKFRVWGRCLILLTFARFLSLLRLYHGDDRIHKYDTRPSLRQGNAQGRWARTIDKVGCRKKEKCPLVLSLGLQQVYFPTPWQHPVPPKRRTAACDKCVDVDTFSHRLGPRKRRAVRKPIVHQGDKKGRPTPSTPTPGR
jgi:hypothetical protein